MSADKNAMMTRAKQLQSEFIDSGCSRHIMMEYFDTLMAECGSLFENEDEGFRFLCGSQDGEECV